MHNFVATRLLELSRSIQTLCTTYSATSDFEHPSPGEQSDGDSEISDIACLTAHAASFADKIQMASAAQRAYKLAISLSEGAASLAALSSFGTDGTSSQDSGLDTDVVNGWKFEHHRLNLVVRTAKEQEYFAAFHGIKKSEPSTRAPNMDSAVDSTAGGQAKSTLDTVLNRAQVEFQSALRAVDLVTTHLSASVRKIDALIHDESGSSRNFKQAETAHSTEEDLREHRKQARKRRIAAIRARQATGTSTTGALPPRKRASGKPIRGSSASLSPQQSSISACATSSAESVERRIGLSLEQFHAEFSTKAKPLIIGGLQDQIFPNGIWDIPYLLEHLSAKTAQGGQQVPLQQANSQSCLWARLEDAGQSRFADYLVRKCVVKFQRSIVGHMTLAVAGAVAQLPLVRLVLCGHMGKLPPPCCLV